MTNAAPTVSVILKNRAELPLYARDHYQVFAFTSISAAAQGEKYFTLDLGDGAFVARSMKRLEKARLHVQDELLRVGSEKSSLKNTGAISFYLEPSMFD